MQTKKNEFLIKLFDLNRENKFLRSVIVALRVISVSIFRFLKDDCLTKASGIAYTAIVSLVPMLTVALALITITSGFNEKKDVLFDEINSFLLKNNILIDINPYLETLNSIISAATQIGAIGFVVLIFSATAVLRTFETSFNQIWRIQSDRSFFNKLIFYFFILTIGPLLFMTIGGISEKVSGIIRSPHYFSIARSSDNYLWISGEKGTILKVNENGKRLAILKDLKIDFENMKCLNSFGEDIGVCNKPKIQSENFVKIRNKGKTLFAISENGVLLDSTNLGAEWNVTYFNGTKFKDFSIVTEDQLFLVMENGELLRYNRNGISYKPVFTGVLKMSANKITFFNETIGFILDTNGTLWKTKDGGDSFVPQKISTNSINDIEALNPMTLFVVGDRGTILKSEDGGNNWLNISHKRNSYKKLWILSDSNGPVILVLNDIGEILQSFDSGVKWVSYQDISKAKPTAMITINPKVVFTSFKEEKQKEAPNSEVSTKTVSGDILSVGEFRKISIGDIQDKTIVWENIQGGGSVFSLYSIFGFIVPLFGVWIFFLSLFLLIPNDRVPFLSAAIGACVTGVIFLMFSIFFKFYVTSFSETTMIIYRALAVIPISLLGVYSLSLIVLFGAEITATLHHKERYLLPEHPFVEIDESLQNGFYKGVSFLQEIYRSQRDKGTLLSNRELQKKLNFGITDYENLERKLQESNLITVSTQGEVCPVKRSEDLSLYSVYEILVGESFHCPLNEENLENTKKLTAHFQLLGNTVKSQFSSIHFSDLI
ncbi:MAG: YihY/virulence factor BrkB family protein [Leptospiraceae bacterium]|nr:YihY/virulence factor BrkB family protein [Leptospiraceae bacterium]MCK6379702.1 YihY/virulence factor BrkB family protein [Leptospiraceae bacterium]NUM40506.1 YihY/virulence factor BrkB family protein [Leptospiraceae bacterium]